MINNQKIQSVIKKLEEAKELLLARNAGLASDEMISEKTVVRFLLSFLGLKRISEKTFYTNPHRTYSIAASLISQAQRNRVWSESWIAECLGEMAADTVQCYENDFIKTNRRDPSAEEKRLLINEALTDTQLDEISESTDGFWEAEINFLQGFFDEPGIHYVEHNFFSDDYRNLCNQPLVDWSFYEKLYTDKSSTEYEVLEKFLDNGFLNNDDEENLLPSLSETISEELYSHINPYSDYGVNPYSDYGAGFSIITIDEFRETVFACDPNFKPKKIFDWDYFSRSLKGHLIDHNPPKDFPPCHIHTDKQKLLSNFISDSIYWLMNHRQIYLISMAFLDKFTDMDLSLESVSAENFEEILFFLLDQESEEHYEQNELFEINGIEAQNKYISKAMIRLLSPNVVLQNENVFYDPNCGTGSNILEAINSLLMSSHNKTYIAGGTIEIRGCEASRHLRNIANLRIGLFINEDKVLKFRDELKFNIDIDDNISKAPLKPPNIILCNPDDKTATGFNFRFVSLLQEFLDSVHQEGRFAIVCPKNILGDSFVRNALRTVCLEDKLEAVVGITEELNILVFNKVKPVRKRKQILLTKNYDSLSFAHAMHRPLPGDKDNTCIVELDELEFFEFDISPSKYKDYFHDYSDKTRKINQELIQLSDICGFTAGTPESIHNGLICVGEENKGLYRIPIITGETLSTGSKHPYLDILSTNMYTGKLIPREERGRIIKNQTLLVSMSPDGELYPTIFDPTKSFHSNAPAKPKFIIASDVVSITPKNDKQLDIHYLLFSLGSSNLVKKQVKQLLKTKKALSLKDIKSIVIHLPSLLEDQKFIYQEQHKAQLKIKDLENTIKENEKKWDEEKDKTFQSDQLIFNNSLAQIIHALAPRLSGVKSVLNEVLERGDQQDLNYNLKSLQKKDISRDAETIEEALVSALKNLDHASRYLEDQSKLASRIIDRDDFEPVNLKEFLDEVISDFKREKGKPKFKIIPTNVPTFMPIIEIHKVLFREMITELIRNAEKYAFNEDNENENKLQFTVGLTEKCIRIDYWNNGEKWPAEITEEKFLSMGDPNMAQGGGGHGGFLINQSIKNHLGELIIVKDSKHPVHLKILLPINRDLYKQSSDSLKDYQINFSKEAVISVSAAETYHLIKEYAVHACPGNYRYQKTGYITFRMPPRGEMEQIYKIEKIITISRSQINDIRQGSYFVPLGGDNRRIKDLKQLLTENEKERFEEYVKNSPFMHYLKESQMGYDVEDRFYFLSPYTLIPKGFLPKIYSTQPEYYSISEMVNPIK